MVARIRRAHWFALGTDFTVKRNRTQTAADHCKKQRRVMYSSKDTMEVIELIRALYQTSIFAPASPVILINICINNKR